MKKRLFIISPVIFLFLTGCGNFSANNLSLEQLEETVDANNIDVPAGKTPVSKDQEILNEYLSEFNSFGSEEIKKLTDDIRSFEILAEKEEKQFKSLALRMHARTNRLDSSGTTIPACQNLITLRTTYITLSRLQSSVFLGNTSNYEFKLHCTDSRCDEMVVSVRRTSGDDQVGLVLIGLKSTTFNSGSYNRRYVSRSVNIEEYFTRAVTPEEYENRLCSREDDNDDENDDLDPVNPLELDTLFDTF